MADDGFEDILEWSGIEGAEAMQLTNELSERLNKWNARHAEGLWIYQLYGHVTAADTVLIPQPVVEWASRRGIMLRVVPHHSDNAPSVSGKDRNAVVFRWRSPQRREAYRETFGLP